jgi:CYTH domain-containing protein
MGREIERKFLVSSDAWRHQTTPVPYAQGYLCRGTGRTVRVRIAGQEAFLTIKGPVSGISRAEFEYPLPLSDAQELLTLCPDALIRKSRSHLLHEGHLWEIDQFEGANAGLIVAEIELKDPEEVFSMPSWLGKEVSGDPRYYNSNLTIHPFSTWSDHSH